MPDPVAHRLHAKRALLANGWASDVTIEIGSTGIIEQVVQQTAPAAGDFIAAGPVIPAMPNLHSHAFQRAMAGLAEIAGPAEDSFWTWRDEMYRTAAALSPDDVAAIAAKLYVELMKGGFGAVAEFHYLHHGPGGAAYGDRAAMSKAILAAAETSGIGLTLLPVFYAHSNFGGAPAKPGQARFLHDIDRFLALLDALGPACAAGGATLGYAFHSLRAATPDQMRAILDSAPSGGPIHIHVAEQVVEVEDCVAWSGRRPVEWLLDEMPVDARWCLIHATQSEPAEIARIAQSGAVVGLCPATEANLGDGIFPGVAYSAAAGRYGIGTDSHVATGVAEELRLLEYSQRLRDRRRNRLVSGAGQSAGRSMFDTALGGGAQALGRPIGGIARGMKASLAVLDDADPYVGTATGDQVLDRWLFALGDRAVRDVMVEGTWQIRDGRHRKDDEIDRNFRDVLTRLSLH